MSYRPLRHCADAVLSFANKATVVSQIMARLADFVIHWAQTPSDYDVLIAKTMTAEWAQEHLPVLSRGGEHFLYTSYLAIESLGMPVRCPRSACGVENRVWDQLGPGKYLVRCLDCWSTALIKEIVPLDTKTPLGRHELIKVKYPLEQAWIDWRINPKLPGRSMLPSQAPSQPTAPLQASQDVTGLVPPPHSIALPSPSSVNPSPPPPTPSPTPSPSVANPPLKFKLPARPLRNISRTPSTSSESGHSSHLLRETPSKVYVKRANTTLTPGERGAPRCLFAEIPPLHISPDSHGHMSSGRLSSSTKKHPREEE